MGKRNLFREIPLEPPRVAQRKGEGAAGAGESMRATSSGAGQVPNFSCAILAVEKS